VEDMVIKAPNINFWRNKRVLITGHTGFKGTWLVQILKNYGCEIVGCGLPVETNPSLYDRANTFSLMSNKEYLIPEFVDINHSDSLKQAVHQFKPEIVFHLAAQPLVLEGYRNPFETFQTNVLGTVNLLNVLRETSTVHAIVVVTTDKVYQNNEQIWPYREHDQLGGKDPYSASKACSEIVTACYRQSFFEQLDVGLAAARAGNVIGGGDWSANRLIPDIIKAVLTNTPVTLRNPHATRPWQHVLEPLWGYIRLVECLSRDVKSFSQGYNFGPELSDNLTVSAMTKIVLEIMNSKVAVNHEESSVSEAQLLNLDSTKAKLELGWQPKMASTEAINATCEWYKQENLNICVEKLFQTQIQQFFEK
jgi:CDP-glucose 4,6-dehydratase